MNTEKVKVKTQGDISMSLYDINKNIIKQLPLCDENKLQEIKEEINNAFSEEVKYYMLLCRELNYYTILHNDSSPFNEFDTLGDVILTLTQEMNRPIITSNKFKDRYEIWLKDNDDAYLFILFPYDQGVINYG